MQDTAHFWFREEVESDGLYKKWRSVGTMLGLAVYNDIQIEARLPELFFSKLLGNALGGLNHLKLIFPVR